MRKLALGLNFKQLIVSDGGWDTSMSLFGFAAVVVLDVPPNENPLLVFEEPNSDILY